MQEKTMDVAVTRSWVHGIASAVDEHTDQLTQLDSAIGDADHGANMRRGFGAVLVALDGRESTTVGDVLVITGMTLINNVGGAAGPLYGSAFRAMGKALPVPVADGKQLLAGLTDGLAAIRRLGSAAPGDKTIVDAYAPALAAFESELAAGGDLVSATAQAADAAEEGMRATVPLEARKGRASYLGPRSAGHQDPGATSTALIFRALAQALTTS
jgi:dihydroxyacetone kinase-like protein